ncbi:MAG: hypothetical protein K1X48_03095 [Burkholderiaceae bacterium]|nr:hypothetical protein [Burkholderiaceae bacterium]
MKALNKILKYLNIYFIFFFFAFGIVSWGTALFAEMIFDRDYILSFIPTITFFSFFYLFIFIIAEIHKTQKNNKIKKLS